LAEYRAAVKGIEGEYGGGGFVGVPGVEGGDRLALVGMEEKDDFGFPLDKRPKIVCPPS